MRLWSKKPVEEAPVSPTKERKGRWEDLHDEVTADAERYLKYAIPRGGTRRYGFLAGMQLDAAATRNYHRIEKGFSLPSPKRPFGSKSIPALELVLENKALDESKLYADEARLALEALNRWNEFGEVPEATAPLAESLPGNPLDAETLAQFMTSRRSIRSFEQRPVDRELIAEAVRLATYAPSVCNRQGWRAAWFDDREDISRILAMHDGSRGFADGVPGLFIITFDIRAFENTPERNQGWIDGALFAQNLLLALHGLNLGAVPLNWSRRNRSSDRLRPLAGIPEHENIVMLIAAGHPAPGHRVARSARRPVNEILRFGTTQA